MRYIPKLSPQEIEQNHQHFSQRISVYKKRGLDFWQSRELILAKAGALQGSILEIGSGTGYTTLSLAKAGYKFISIDKDRECLRTAALNLVYENLLPNVQFYLMDAQALDFANDSFNNVVMVNLFHHVTDVRVICSEADRVLSANGKLVLADFNQQGMQIIDSVHQQEGRRHENSNISQDIVYSYLHKLGYQIRNYHQQWQWVLIAKKKIRP